MPRATVRIEGLSELGDNLRRLGDAVRRDISRDAVEAAAEPVREGMARRARRAPRASRPRIGHLADNIVTVTRVDRNGATAQTGPNEEAFWGRFLEFGTRHHSAFPFARPAWDAEQGTALDEMIDTLSDGIEREAR